MTVDTQLEALRVSFQWLVGGAAALHNWQQQYTTRLDAAHQADLAALAQQYAAQRREAEAARRRQEAIAADVLAQESAAIYSLWQVARTSLGFDVARWEDLSNTPHTPPAVDAPPAALRIGNLRLAGDPGHWELPALAPMLRGASLCIDARHSPAAATAGQALLQSLLLRLTLTCPPRRVQLTLCEPGGTGSLLAGFLHLPQEQRGPRIFVRPDEVAAQLAQMNEQITRVAQERLRNVYPTVEAYNAANPATAVPYRVLGIAGLPAGMDERLWATLLQVARTGPAAGVYLLATLDGLTAPQRNVVLDDLLALCTPLTFTAPDRLRWRDPELGEFTVTPDAPPPAAQMNAWLAAISEGLAQTVTALDFSQIAPSPAHYWQARSRDGLAIPIGLDSTGALHTLQLGQGVVHHALVGGVTGSGKSNLLHVLITQLALTYSPDDLALYLMDFREGVEFQDYVDLPHARVVALESEREFALSVLERLQAEREARGELFKRHGAQFLADFVAASGRPLPRILLMIDEFQVLFAEEDALARRAGQILEDLTRRGRGFGLHILLSSQTPAISGLYSRTLYEQMGLRVALRCTPQVSQAVLGEGNITASQLTHAGQAIVNDGLGERNHNREVQVSLLPAAARRAALTTVRALAAGRADPPTRRRDLGPTPICCRRWRGAPRRAPMPCPSGWASRFRSSRPLRRCWNATKRPTCW
jgi:S-DNA-T family DNA segregation ATPase FtsK/SpoIIIE